MKKTKEELKSYFETGDKPTQEQYADLIDSYIDAKQPVGEANREFKIDENGEVTIVSEKVIPEYTLSNITNNKLSLLKDGVVVKEIDLTSYIDDTNLSRLVSGEVDEKGIATFKRDDNSEFIVDFRGLFSSVNDEKIIERTVLVENYVYDFINQDIYSMGFFSDSAPIVGLKYNNKDYFFHGGDYATDYTEFNLEDFITFSERNTGNFFSDIDMFKQIYTKVYLTIGEKLPHWSTWRREGKDVYMPRNGYGATIDPVLLSNITFHNAVERRTLNTTFSVKDSHSYTTNEIDLIVSRRIVIDKNSQEIKNKEKFLVDGFELENVSKWRYLEKTSDLLNDGEGNFPFITSNQLGGLIPEYSISDITNNKLSLLKDGVVIKEIDFTDSFSTGISEKPTNLSFSATQSEGVIQSSTGQSAIIPISNNFRAGLMKAGFYEEGTWVPNIGDAYNVENSSGTYVRNGNLVYIDVRISGIDMSRAIGPNSLLQIIGIPYRVRGNQNQVFNCNVFAGSNKEFETILPCFFSGYGDKIVFKSHSSSKFGYGFSDEALLKGVSFSNGEVRLNGTYVTNVYTQ
ncbi:hypothetical protein [uncultured Tenacibaculum sp.]|uniref:hypothetical protein n=1 Tax=uncultured Tenacibaculum sp. TaxID=174713 RepID=UPI002634DDA5|nr:hypothetical protein [uncultured Tenacibaculum sp.]